MINALQDKDRMVRSRAVQALGETRNANAIKFLCQALDDSAIGVRLSTVGVLENIGDPQAVIPFIQVLEDEISSVRCNAA